MLAGGGRGVGCVWRVTVFAALRARSVSPPLLRLLNQDTQTLVTFAIDELNGGLVIPPKVVGPVAPARPNLALHAACWHPTGHRTR